MKCASERLIVRVVEPSGTGMRSIVSNVELWHMTQYSGSLRPPPWISRRTWQPLQVLTSTRVRRATGVASVIAK